MAEHSNITLEQFLQAWLLFHHETSDFNLGLIFTSKRGEMKNEWMNT